MFKLKKLHENAQTLAHHNPPSNPNFSFLQKVRELLPSHVRSQELAVVLGTLFSIVTHKH